MQARGPLMIEHRLIERMIAVIQKTLEQIESTQAVDPLLVDTAVDFIRKYADRTHHGKEEDILFQKLDKRSLSDEDRRLMEELIEEHVFSRRATQALAAANGRYRQGDEAALKEIVDAFHRLIELYPRHIEKEDKIFFPASRRYFSEDEDKAMLEAFWEFDRKMIHEKYESLIEDLENQQ